MWFLSLLAQATLEPVPQASLSAPTRHAMLCPQCGWIRNKKAWRPSQWAAEDAIAEAEAIGIEHLDTTARSEASTRHADRLLEFAEHGVTDVNALGSQPAKDGSRTLDERLLELHIEETLKDRLSWSSHLNPCSNLLATLCKREATNKLVVDLLPDAQGYQLSATTTDGQVHTT